MGISSSSVHSKFQMSLQQEDILPWCHCYLF